jgi:cupin fold WbuC family metalloprotein
MIKIFSKIIPEKLLHIVCSHSMRNQKIQRVDIVPEDNFIQCAFLNMEKGKTFPPHKHIKKERLYKEKIAQESWVILKGSVKFIFYDLDDSPLGTFILKQGDASFTLEGGHTYEILEDDTLVYEYKTGPYEGQENDKVFLEKK